MAWKSRKIHAPSRCILSSKQIHLLNWNIELTTTPVILVILTPGDLLSLYYLFSKRRCWDILMEIRFLPLYFLIYVQIMRSTVAWIFQYDYNWKRAFQWAERILSNWNFGFSNSNMWGDFKFKLKVSFGIKWKIMVALLTIKGLIRVEKVNWSSNDVICTLVGMVIWTSTSAISSFPFTVSTCWK